MHSTWILPTVVIAWKLTAIAIGPNLACHRFWERWKLGHIGVSNIVDEQIIAQGADRMNIGFLAGPQAECG